MNKELYIKGENVLKEVQELNFLVNTLQNFLAENESNFKRKESIEALKNIREYLTKKENELKIVVAKHRKINRELYSTCKHEIAVKKMNTFSYQCLICNRYLGENIPKTSLISIDTTKDYQVSYKIVELFDEVVHSDKDLIETISNAIEEMQYEREIKVYRRSL